MQQGQLACLKTAQRYVGATIETTKDDPAFLSLTAVPPFFLGDGWPTVFKFVLDGLIGSPAC